MTPTRKNKLTAAGIIVGLFLFELFYFTYVFPIETTLAIAYFWVFFLVWFASSLILSLYFGRTYSGAKAMLILAGIVFIVGSIMAGLASGRLDFIFGPLLPGWYGGVILALVIYAIKSSPVFQTDWVN